MPIDINLVREEKGGDPNAVKESEVRRGRGEKLVNDVIEVDKKWRAKVFETEQSKKEINSISKEIGQRKKVDKKDNCSDLFERSIEAKKHLPVLEVSLAALTSERDSLLSSIGNIVHDSVPVSNDEKDNLIVKMWGKIDKSKVIDGTPGKLHHHEILDKLNGYESKRGVAVAGHRGYYLRGVGVLLNHALINYGLKFLRMKGYTPIQPPYFMRRDIMAATAELKDFNETLYKIPMSTSDASSEAAQKKEKDGSEDHGNTDLFLIATSEQPISALHRDEFIEERTLPYRYAGSSTCFRKEAGSHGKDTWGIFRIHQFEKIEQFILCTPEESWKLHEEMIQTAEEFYQSLQLPYRVVSIVSGAMNDAAAKKYDLEAWFPGYADFRELVSCSNCTDYQSRALNCRLGHPKLGDREKRFVHMLNGTLVATQRTMCCILENYQKEDGVAIPRVLVPYMDGMEFIPFPEKLQE